MNEKKSWKVIFYTESNGVAPVISFLRALPPDDQASIAEAIRKLLMYNIHACRPLVRHMRGKLWELRTSGCTNPYRLIYFIDSKRQIIFLHGFPKKTQKTPRQDILLAFKRYQQWMARTEMQVKHDISSENW